MVQMVQMDFEICGSLMCRILCRANLAESQILFWGVGVAHPLEPPCQKNDPMDFVDFDSEVTCQIIGVGYTRITYSLFYRVTLFYSVKGVFSRRPGWVTIPGLLG